MIQWAIQYAILQSKACIILIFPMPIKTLSPFTIFVEDNGIELYNNIAVSPCNNEISSYLKIELKIQNFLLHSYGKILGLTSCFVIKNFSCCRCDRLKKKEMQRTNGLEGE